MPKNYEVISTEADEIERRYRELTGIRTEYLRLSDNARYTGEIVELEDLTLIWTNLTGKMRWRDTLEGDSLNLSVLVSGDGTVKIGGRLADSGTVYVWQPSREIEMVMEGPVCTLEVCIPSGVIKSPEWKPGDHRMGEVPKHIIDDLVRACITATVVNKTNDHAPFPESLRNEILEVVSEVLQPWMEHRQELPSQKGHRNYQLVRKADDYLRGMNYQSELSINELCAELSTSRRNLFHAFHEILGIGPRRYLELLRLQELRRRLKAASAKESTVTALANELGFPHMGRLAASYRQHFGENPSDTLYSASH